MLHSRNLDWLHHTILDDFAGKVLLDVGVLCRSGLGPDPSGLDSTGRHGVSEQEGAGPETELSSQDLACARAGRSELELDGAGAYKPRTWRIWIGAGPKWTGSDELSWRVRARRSGT